MTSDSHLFKDSTAPERLPLYEAKMIHQFDHRWASYRLEDGKNTSGDVALVDKHNPDFYVMPRYWVDRVEVEQRLQDRNWRNGWMLGYRRISNATNERTFLITPIPAYAAGDSVFLIFSDQLPQLVSALVGCLNSLIFDFVCRQKWGDLI